MSTEIRVLQALRLKGRATADLVAGAAGLAVTETAAVLEHLVELGHAELVRDRLKLTPPGRSHLEALLAEERDEVDHAALKSAYDRFDDHNSALKRLMTRWQLRDESTPNDHTDPAYDAAVIADLGSLHDRFEPLLDHFVDLVRRLAHYPDRFGTALSHIAEGDHSWFARPIVDSYHTVWFELHEELLGVAGLSRADEAAAGRAE